MFEILPDLTINCPDKHEGNVQFRFHSTEPCWKSTANQVPISSKNFQKYWLQGQNISFDFA